MCPLGTSWRAGEKTATYKLRRNTSEETNLADAQLQRFNLRTVRREMHVVKALHICHDSPGQWLNLWQWNIWRQKGTEQLCRHQRLSPAGNPPQGSPPRAQNQAQTMEDRCMSIKQRGQCEHRKRGNGGAAPMVSPGSYSCAHVSPPFFCGEGKAKENHRHSKMSPPKNCSVGISSR